MQRSNVILLDSIDFTFKKIYISQEIFKLSVRIENIKYQKRQNFYFLALLVTYSISSIKNVRKT